MLTEQDYLALEELRQNDENNEKTTSCIMDANGNLLLLEENE